MTDAGPAPGQAADPAVLHLLMAWLSPSFPVGAFSYSHGLEWAVEDGTVRDAASLAGWAGDVLRHGAGQTDAALLAHAWRATTDADAAALAEIAELAAAFQPSRERQLEATAQGRAFLVAVGAAWPAAGLALLPQAGPVAYPVGVGTAAAAHGLPLVPTVHAYLHAFAANLVSAAVRAVPLGQSDGQRVLAGLVPIMQDVADQALGLELAALGGAALRADIASMRHETQYTRLFRS